MFDFVSSTVYEMVDGVDSEPLDGVFHDTRNKVMKQLTLLDGSGNATTSLSSAVTASLEDWRGVTTEFSIIDLSTDPAAPDYAGRLTKITDRNGYALTVTYRDSLAAGSGGFTAQELIDAPDRRFQIYQVVDFQGDTGTIEYGATQVGGRWAVSRIVMPDGSNIDYAYAGDRLASVDYANGSQATFVYGQDPVAQTATVDVYEPRSGNAPTKVHITNDYMTLGEDVINQPQGVLRMVEDDGDEVKLMILQSETDPNEFTAYKGNSMAAKVIPGVSNQFYEDGWSLQPTVDPPFVGDLEPTYESLIGASMEQIRTGQVPQVTDATGRTYSYQYDADTFPTRKTYDGDGTYEEWAYNADKQVTRKRDRMGRVTQYEYDTHGNLTKTKVGILEVNGVDVNQPEYAEQVNEYYPSTHVNKGLLKTAFSPLYDHTAGSTDMYRTDYEYDGRGNLTKMLESAAHPGEDRPEWTYTYDGEDRTLTQTSPMGHTITYMYDDQDRVIRTTYDDGSTEETLYGATGSGQEHLALKTKDRRDVVTDYQYDTSGRPVTVTRAAATDADVLDGQIDNPITDRNKKSISTSAYLEGTSLTTSVAVDGSTTDTVWDYRHRTLESIWYPAANRTLRISRTYVENDQLSTEDPYGRRTFYGYRESDGVLVRYVTGAFPSFSMPDETRSLCPSAGSIAESALRNQGCDQESCRTTRVVGRWSWRSAYHRV